MRGRRRLDYRSDRPSVLQNIAHRAVCTVGGGLHRVGVRCRNDVFLPDDGASWSRQFIDPIQFHDARPLSATARNRASTLRDSNANVWFGGSGPCADLSRRMVQSPWICSGSSPLRDQEEGQYLLRATLTGSWRRPPPIPPWHRVRKEATQNHPTTRWRAV